MPQQISRMRSTVLSPVSFKQAKQHCQTQLMSNNNLPSNIHDLDGKQLPLQGPYNFWQWIADHKKEMAPPVSNGLMFGNNSEMKVMILAGPNKRSDFHIESHDEFFYQLKGDINVRIRDEKENKFVDIPIKEGEMYVIPARVPHSPMRPADTIGLVLEVERKQGELDACRWYCEKCEAIVHEEWFYCQDLVAQLKPILNNYYDKEECRTCKKCGHINAIPE